MIANVSAALAPPPGAGVITLTGMSATLLRSDAAILAVSVVDET